MPEELPEVICLQFETYFTRRTQRAQRNPSSRSRFPSFQIQSPQFFLLLNLARLTRANQSLRLRALCVKFYHQRSCRMLMKSTHAEDAKNAEKSNATQSIPIFPNPIFQFFLLLNLARLTRANQSLRLRVLCVRNSAHAREVGGCL